MNTCNECEHFDPDPNFCDFLEEPLEENDERAQACEYAKEITE